MKLIGITALALGLVAMSAPGLTAQSQETKTTRTTKVELKHGHTVTMNGCLARQAEGGYTLTNAREHAGQTVSDFSLVTDDNLSSHVGHEVQIKGKTVKNGSGTMKVESTVKTEVEGSKDVESKSTREGTPGMFTMALLGVDSIKMVSATCR
jgi:hypothetical protein